MGSRPLVLAIDDDQFYLNEIKEELSSIADCKFFNNPNDFEQQITEEDIEEARLIIVDYDFGNFTAVTSDIAGFIKNKLNYRGKIILSSLLEEFGKDSKKVSAVFDAIIDKNELRKEVLRQYIV